MRKTSLKSRLWIKRYNEKNRHKKRKRLRFHWTVESKKKSELLQLCLKTNEWIDEEKKSGLIVTKCIKEKQKRCNMIVLHLPEKLDLEKSYHETVQIFTAIRKLVNLLEQFRGYKLPQFVYKIGSVNFDKLKSISTPAALILTAEISRWDTSIRKKLVPQVDSWNEEIYHSFSQLGFFDLFKNKPKKISNGQKNIEINYVKYFKGSCANKEHATNSKKELKQKIRSLTGNEVPAWTLLHSGLSEAVTNVTHHAYPDDQSSNWHDKSWYLTGSFNTSSRVLTISFFDQGIGIPNSLPNSTIWENVLEYMSLINIPAASRRLDSVLLKAAVNMPRTRTGQDDRGKGLQDLLEFIRQRKEGSLSIYSKRGSYECTYINGKNKNKSKSYLRPLCGTLITWSVTLEELSTK
ncbi:MAG: hypothetical protein ACRC2Y_05805 [Aeromonas veronii]